MKTQSAMKTQYILVDWAHNAPNEPIRLYYELDSNRRELRKVEEYRDGTLHSADASHGQGSTFLAWEPHPPQSEIEASLEFRVREMTSQEFDAIWNHARHADLLPVAR